jgi:hypothetical protein
MFGLVDDPHAALSDPFQDAVARVIDQGRGDVRWVRQRRIRLTVHRVLWESSMVCSLDASRPEHSLHPARWASRVASLPRREPATEERNESGNLRMIRVGRRAHGERSSGLCRVRSRQSHKAKGIVRPPKPPVYSSLPNEVVKKYSGPKDRGCGQSSGRVIGFEPERLRFLSPGQRSGFPRVLIPA